ncbi:hypothetical protein D3C83_51180 [compost metagenome]
MAVLPSQSPKLRRPLTWTLQPMPNPRAGSLTSRAGSLTSRCGDLCLRFSFQPINAVALSMHCFSSQLVILWLCGETSPGSTAFMRRSCAISMPSFSAARSHACSTAQSAEGFPKPRNAPVGTRFV